MCAKTPILHHGVSGSNPAWVHEVRGSNPGYDAPWHQGFKPWVLWHLFFFFNKKLYIFIIYVHIIYNTEK